MNFSSAPECFIVLFHNPNAKITKYSKYTNPAHGHRSVPVPTQHTQGSMRQFDEVRRPRELNVSKNYYLYGTKFEQTNLNKNTMYRSHTCGELRSSDIGRTVTLAGWVQKVRNLGAMTFIDLRDRYGITQIVVEEHSPEQTRAVAASLGREYVLQAKGRVIERSSKNPKMPTGDIEVAADELIILNEAPDPALHHRGELGRR